jgi:hypothetical protein
MWKGRGAFSTAFSAARIGGLVLLGFAVWNFIDIVGFHWLIGIHRVRMDSPQPLLWDLLWLAAFGVLPLGLVWLLRSRAKGGGPGTRTGREGHSRNLTAWAVIAVGVTALGLWAARPPPDAQVTLVFYPPGTSGATIFRGLDAADARVVWVGESKTLWALELVDPDKAGVLYRHGAWTTSRSFAVAACASWARYPDPPAAASVRRQTRTPPLL